jgi:hypothetical protein
VLIGDLQALRSFGDPEGCRRAVGILVAVLRQINIPGVLFETTAPRKTWEVAPSGYPTERGTEVTTPSSVDFADVVIEVLSERNRDAENGPLFKATDARRGREYQGRLPRA